MLPHRYVDDLTFTLTESSNGDGCQVEAYSTSRLWFVNHDYYYDQSIVVIVVIMIISDEKRKTLVCNPGMLS